MELGGLKNRLQKSSVAQTLKFVRWALTLDRRGRMELAVYLVQWARQRLVRDRCVRLLAAHDALKAQILHQSCDGAARNIKAFSSHLMPDLANAIDADVFLKDTLDFRPQFFVTLAAIRKA